jgi:hypothetical protein
MRRLLFFVSIGIVVVVLLAITPPAHAPADLIVTEVPTGTPLPEDFTLIPAFTPAYPCELENVDVYDVDMCRGESVQEYAIVESDQSVLYVRAYHLGTGCWSGINVDVRELRVCERESGAVTTLVEHLTADPVPSPDGEWYAFDTFEMYQRSESDGGSFRPHFFRVRTDGSDLQELSSQPLPPEIVGGGVEGWSDDGEWLELSLWDGTEDGWHPYRLRTDGSGEYEAE